MALSLTHYMLWRHGAEPQIRRQKYVNNTQMSVSAVSTAYHPAKTSEGISRSILELLSILNDQISSVLVSSLGAQ